MLTGIFMAGASLSQFNIVIKLSPTQGRSVYLALYAAITGLAGGIAPIIGGMITHASKDFQLTLFSYTISNLQLVFMLSMGIQILAFLFIWRIYEPKVSSPMAVIMQLKNDLNPQTGIASTTDFIVIKVRKTKSILKKADEFTDKIAENSEERIGFFLDKVISIINKPIKKIRDFFKD